jgi:non-ribosomal peptide synthase protein (TIGR01720 family)
VGAWGCDSPGLPGEAMGTERVADVPARHALEITAAIRDGELSLALAWLPAALDDTTVTELTQRWLNALDGLRDVGGGSTPADFPLTAVGQDEIDEFEELAIEMERGNRP